MSDQDLVDKMEAVWLSITDLCQAFSEDQWKTPTDCPGWSAQDQVSHMVGSETSLLGRRAPEHTSSDTSHVKNDIGRTNEVQVDWRRNRPGAQVLKEFREITGLRLQRLRAMTTDEFAADTQTPIGPGSMRDMIAIRIFDAWVHEQDIRRAVNIPGDIEGPVAEHSVGRLALAMPYVVGRKVQPADSTTVTVSVTGAAGRSIAIAMEGARANQMDMVPLSPTTGLTMDVETFLCLTCGRWDPVDALSSGRVQVQGDSALGHLIVQQMNIMV